MPSHYLNQCWVIGKWTLRNKCEWNSNQNTKLFIHENASENTVCQMEAILSKGRWVKQDAATWQGWEDTRIVVPQTATRQHAPFGHVHSEYKLAVMSFITRIWFCTRHYVIAVNIYISLQWHHNGHDSVSNHQPCECLLSRLIRRRSKKASKLRVIGLRAGN